MKLCKKNYIIECGITKQWDEEDCSSKLDSIGRKKKKEGTRVIYHRTDEFIIEPRQAALVFSGQTIPCGIVGRLIVHFHLSVRADGLTKKEGGGGLSKKEKAARRRADRKRNSRNPRRITRRRILPRQIKIRSNGRTRKNREQKRERRCSS